MEKVRQKDRVLEELQKGGDAEEAMASMQALLLQHPSNHQVCFAIAAIHGLMGKNEKTLEWCDRALKIYPYLWKLTIIEL